MSHGSLSSTGGQALASFSTVMKWHPNVAILIDRSAPARFGRFTAGHGTLPAPAPCSVHGCRGRRDRQSFTVGPAQSVGRVVIAASRVGGTSRALRSLGSLDRV